MVGVQINPVSGLPSGYPVPFLSSSSTFQEFNTPVISVQLKLCWHFPQQDLLRFVLQHVEEKNVEPLLEVC